MEVLTLVKWSITLTEGNHVITYSCLRKIYVIDLHAKLGREQGADLRASGSGCSLIVTFYISHGRTGQAVILQENMELCNPKSKQLTLVCLSVLP